MQTQKIPAHLDKAIYPDSPELQLDQAGIQNIIQTSNASKRIERITEMSREKQILIDGLQADIVGQDETCYEVADLIETGIFNVFNKKGPLGVGFFAGPTGVGKTQIARSLAKFLLGNENHFTKVSCEQLFSKYTIGKLFGAAPGYIGYGDNTSIHPDVVFEGYKTAKKRKKLHPLVKDLPNFSILLFDEIEKAHPDVIKSLLGLLEDGKATFEKGEVFTYENTLILFTSNIGEAGTNKNSIGFGNSETSETKNNFKQEFKRVFPAEFRGRLDLIQELNHISQEDCKKIIGKRVEVINKSLKAYCKSGNIYLDLSDKTIDYLISKGYSKEYGARTIPRTIDRYISKPLGAIIRKNKDIMTRKNPTIIHFDIDTNTNKIFGDLYKKEIVPENMIVNESDAESNTEEILSKGMVLDQVLETSDVIRLCYEQLADEYCLEDDEIDILQGIDGESVKGILEQVEIDGGVDDVYSTEDVFGSFKPAKIFEIIKNQGKDLYSKNEYSKEMFIIHLLIKGSSSIAGLMKDKKLSEKQNKAVIKFSITAAINIWNQN